MPLLLQEPDQQTLRDLVCHVLKYGAHKGALLIPNWQWSETLCKPAAVFVTLYHQQALKGCIGTCEARAPLWKQTADYAYHSAFSDRRFAPLTAEELAAIRFTLSVLSPPKELVVKDEQELLAQLTPGSHGLILADARRHAVFLPSVWQHFDEKQAFVAALKQKGGWPAEYWSQSLQTSIFTTFEVHGEVH
ncbi:AmmeMemoRadiSam system protein A [Aliiglaciecola sp. CAU 1673]|uniref:AmmeMemoRadiSam system protein A n=1 Tax=Aliiglaciecola sp. CAU 1673 TaxID=3032595 RepID=UPI0023DBB2CE|nr:AmmeMemoRadiSam system protein A [Aliiglaciecola sp. CAU 1673]MDF2177736.1 AmmeMemoRadiSam system protein A [Aliiglaciecola sp. CAU 1673]